MTEDCTFRLPSEAADEFPVAGYGTGSLATSVGTTVDSLGMLATTTSSISTEFPSESSYIKQYRETLE